jgi:3-oxoacyl-[acyl-carrier-protein] synthase-1
MNIIGTNIISSLGFTTEENFQAVKSGISGLKHYEEGTFGLPEAFVASLIDKERLNDYFSDIPYFKNIEYLTDLEKAAILSVFEANKAANIDLSSEKVLFVLSSTKGNVDLLGNVEALHTMPLSAYLWHTAKITADFFGNPNTPVVVSNACISGAAAQIAAIRELENGNYDYAVALGADFLSKFIISGFQSFKALSPEICRPFDKDRCGLNLGEAAATIIMNNEQLTINNYKNCSLKIGAIRNDANHISGPSRTGEGSFRALNYILQDIDKEKIAFINAHGTATPYNDAMEAVAIERAGLQNVPVNSLKPFFGHTLGAAGVLESIISMRALESGIVLPIKGDSEANMNCNIYINRELTRTDKKYFIKMLSGFGGVNAALLFEKGIKSS